MLFGPVAAILVAQEKEDANRIANVSRFGLGSRVIARDLARGERIAAAALETEMSFVNAHMRSNPRLPLGGVNDSGYSGVCSPVGVHEFVNIKSVLVEGCCRTRARYTLAAERRHTASGL
jgi:succinate-semialdehyde dehydrogenase/glutarate-semialdehyde dehydrogenase